MSCLATLKILALTRRAGTKPTEPGDVGTCQTKPCLAMLKILALPRPAALNLILPYLAQPVRASKRTLATPDDAVTQDTSFKILALSCHALPGPTLLRLAKSVLSAPR